MDYLHRRYRKGEMSEEERLEFEVVLADRSKINDYLEKLKPR
jgi:hypothetical protein